MARCEQINYITTHIVNCPIQTQMTCVDAIHLKTICFKTIRSDDVHSKIKWLDICLIFVVMLFEFNGFSKTRHCETIGSERARCHAVDYEKTSLNS